LAWQAEHGQVTLPRRLVWVVNRRVVVDQATDEAEGLVKHLTQSGDADSAGPESQLAAFAQHLRSLSVLGSKSHPPVAISTLRGKRADNGDWKLDPSRPSIVIGTVDTIGSRLLFSGYGDGKYKRPLHAGLLGQDAWVVLDEAHLTPAFTALLQAIHTEQGRGLIEARSPGTRSVPSPHLRGEFAAASLGHPPAPLQRRLALPRRP
jgi:CRISPR-associated endonuclease/helicase Cas3